LDERRAEQARPIPASRPARLKEAKRRLEEVLWTECEANAAYEAYRARGRERRPPLRPASCGHRRADRDRCRGDRCAGGRAPTPVTGTRCRWRPSSTAGCRC
jgi:hypothetical protein